MKQYLYHLSERIRRDEPLPWPLSGALHALTPLTRLNIALRKRRKRTRVPAQVISYGNLTVGGTGKTPAVLARAREELSKGRRVAVLSRGYGSARIPEPYVVEPGTFRPEMAPMLGDEPALLLRRLPALGLVKSANRVQGALAAIDAFQADTLILDDGYQALYLERDENILLLDAARPFGNGCLLPRGILREPLSGLARATEIMLTRCDQCPPETVDALQAWLRARVDVPIHCTHHAPTGLWEVGSGKQHGLEWLRGRAVVALCGIAKPEHFYKTLEDLGARVVGYHPLRDHGAIPPELLKQQHWIITTEKDAMRLPPDVEGVLVLVIALRDWSPA